MKTADKQHVQQWAGKLHCFVKKYSISVAFARMKVIVEIYHKKSHHIQWAQVPSTSLVTSRVFLCG